MFWLPQETAIPAWVFWWSWTGGVLMLVAVVVRVAFLADALSATVDGDGVKPLALTGLRRVLTKVRVLFYCALGLLLLAALLTVFIWSTGVYQQSFGLTATRAYRPCMVLFPKEPISLFETAGAFDVLGGDDGVVAVAPPASNESSKGTAKNEVSAPSVKASLVTKITIEYRVVDPAKLVNDFERIRTFAKLSEFVTWRTQELLSSPKGADSFDARLARLGREFERLGIWARATVIRNSVRTLGAVPAETE